MSSQFVDLVQVNLRGAGCVAFRREAHVPKGGPDGGDGGSGGDIYVQADRNVASLLAYRDHPHRRAPSGTHGGGAKKHGAGGADLVRHGDRYLAARGGRGGRGNARFLSNARRAPSFAEQGEYGEEHWLRFEVKLLADAALVGFPNAGKSTLISAVSAAKPNLGVVRFRDHEYVLADIPGLIEGAAEGKGLGHQFLRHVERARALVILLDLAAVDGTSPEEQERVLLRELGDYQPELLERPRLVLGSKADVATTDFERPDVLRISAVARQGLDEFLGRLGNLVDEARDAEPEPEPFVVLRPAEEGFAVVRDDDGTFRVTGRAAERVVAMADLTNIEAMEYVQQRLRKMGVDRALHRAGAQEGDLVRIGPVELDYVEGLG